MSYSLGTGLFAERYSHIRETIYFIPFVDEAKATVPYQGFVRFLTFIILYQVRSSFFCWNMSTGVLKLVKIVEWLKYLN